MAKNPTVFILQGNVFLIFLAIRQEVKMAFNEEELIEIGGRFSTQRLIGKANV